MRRSSILIALFTTTLLATAVRSAEAPCPLDLTTCLLKYERMKERPWLGVTLDVDSLDRRVVVEIAQGSPASRAGVRIGDVIENIEGMPAKEWFASKAGWKTGEHGDMAIARGGHSRIVHVPFERIPEDVFARVVGTHMIEGHLAHMHPKEVGDASTK
jgi:predicted metalloprotease with PDZ domain